MGEISDALARERENGDSSPSSEAPRRAPPARAPSPAPPRPAPKASASPSVHRDALAYDAEARRANAAQDYDLAAPDPIESKPFEPEPFVRPRTRRRHPIPRSRTGNWVGRVCVVDPDSSAAVRFRHLAVRIRGLLDPRPERSVLVTSALAGEGKSTVAANLALALGSINPDSRIGLIDLDLRRSNFKATLALAPTVGTEHVLDGSVPLAEAVIPTDLASVELLPVANTTSDAQRLLGTGAERLFRQLHARYDYVVVDGPPVLPVPDVPQIVSSVGGCLLVAASGRTRHARLSETIEMLPRRSLLGVFLNENPAAAERRDYAGYYAAEIDDETEGIAVEDAEGENPGRRATDRPEGEKR